MYGKLTTRYMSNLEQEQSHSEQQESMQYYEPLESEELLKRVCYNTAQGREQIV